MPTIYLATDNFKYKCEVAKEYHEDWDYMCRTCGIRYRRTEHLIYMEDLTRVIVGEFV